MTKILGVKISQLQKEEILNKIKKNIFSNKSLFICTSNPEIILSSYQDEELFFILSKSDLNVADGIGLKLAAFLSSQKLYRYTGADLSLDLLYLANLKNLKVLILNHKNGLSKNSDILDVIKNKYPNINCKVIDNEPNIKLDSLEKIDLIKNFKPDIFFCLFGSPLQEKFIFHNKENLNLKIALGVGGAFDFISQKTKRAPIFFRKIGLEWLWRLILYPKRFKRIFKATIIFTLKVINWRFILPFKYRKNVACLLYREKDKEKEIFIVERNDQVNHWQIPQGGVDGQDILEAGKRELWEETGTSNFEVKKIYKNIYKYKFKIFSKSDYKNNKHHDKFGYKGQKQSLIIAKYKGNDDDIKINFWDHKNYKWVNENDFVESVHPVRQKAAKVFLNYLNK